jgi:hypothetical protein
LHGLSVPSCSGTSASVPGGARPGRVVLLTGFASLVIGVLPTFAAIGVWAPVLLVLAALRIGQLAFSVPASFGFGTGTAMYTEMFPTRVR